MEFLTIDAGSYSVKFLHFVVDKKRIYINDSQEILIREVSKTIDFSEENEHQKVDITRAQIIKDYLESNHFEGKIISLIPQNLVTARYFDIPVTSPKKVEMMIPFQLDDNLPFPSSEAHYVSSLKRQDKSTYAVVNITQKIFFHQYFTMLQAYKALPNVLTSEISAIHSYADHCPVTEQYAILDLGHETSSFYIIQNNRLLSHHTSYIAGQVIDEIISKSYQIPLEEAIIYKHENCFFLTDEQMKEVSAEQKEFALLMKQCSAPLIQDLKRWLLGFRVKHGLAVEKIYITGGSSNIANITHYLSQELEVHVHFLDLADDYQDQSDCLRGKENSFSTSIMSACSMNSRVKLANFLTGDYSQGSSYHLPLHSTLFVSLRVAIIVLVCSLFLIFESLTLKKQANVLSADIRKSLIHPALGLSKIQVNRYKRTPEKLINILKRKNKLIEQEVSVIQSAHKIDALTPLARLTGALGSPDVGEIINFSSKDGIVSATLKMENFNQQKFIEQRLKRSDLEGLTVKNRDRDHLDITFTDVN